MRPTKLQLIDAAAIAWAWIRYRALMGQVPGVSYGVSLDGEVIASGGWGYADLETKRRAGPDTAYRVASITKTVTATLIMQLVERGRVRLDEPVTSYLTWLKPSIRGSGPTVRHLLTHSGGVIRDGSCAWGDRDLMDRDMLRRDLLERATVAEPSAGFRYSNVAYALLGEVIEEVSGRPFFSMVSSGVSRPLGLSATGTRLTRRLRSGLATGYHYRRPGEPYRAAAATEAGAFEAAAGLISNVVDLLEYQQAHFPGDNRLLSELSKREMQRVQWQRSEEPHHGYGWMVRAIDGITVRGHSGGYPGFVTYIAFAPEPRIAAAVLTNGIGPLAELGINAIFHTVARVNELWEDAAAPGHGQSGAAPGHGQSGAAPGHGQSGAAPGHGQSRAALARFVGQYRGDAGERLVARVNRSLYLINPREDRPMRVAARLAPVDNEARFLICDQEDYGRRGEEVSFELGVAGRATALRDGAQVLLRADV